MFDPSNCLRRIHTHLFADDETAETYLLNLRQAVDDHNDICFSFSQDMATLTTGKNLIAIANVGASSGQAVVIEIDVAVKMAHTILRWAQGQQVFDDLLDESDIAQAS